MIAANLAHKANALAGDGAYQPLVITAVANSVPDGSNPAGERGLRDDAAMPHVLNQVVFADHSFAITDEVLQKVQYLRLDINQFSPAAQFLPVDIEGIVFELVDQQIAPMKSGPLKAF